MILISYSGFVETSSETGTGRSGVSPIACIFCKECIYVCEDMRKTADDLLAVDVKHSSDHFVFTVESTGALTAKEIVMDSLTILTSKIVTVAQASFNNLQNNTL